MSEHTQHQQHNHGGHGATQGGHGNEGQTLAQSLGLGGHNQHPGHNFLAHLLGLDHDAHSHGHVNQGASGSQAPSQSAGWTSALQALKLSDAMQGINVTPNFLFILLFAGFTGWLFVIYWIRHHEPLANAVLGTSAHTTTTAADRRLVSGMRNALPFHTSATTGEMYIPIPPTSSVSANSPAAAEAASLPGPMPLPQPPVPPQQPLPPQPTPLARSSFPAYGSGFTQPYSGNAYMVPQTMGGGARVKMIVNR